jgi:hypothetical protein
MSNFLDLRCPRCCSIAEKSRCPVARSRWRSRAAREIIGNDAGAIAHMQESAAPG